MGTRAVLHLISVERVDRPQWTRGEVNGVNRITRLALVSLISAFLGANLTGCSDRGDLNIINDGPSAVAVRTGDIEVIVDANGGAALLGYGCTVGDVTVDFAPGSQVVLPGPVCPDQWVVIRASTATLQPAQALESP